MEALKVAHIERIASTLGKSTSLGNRDSVGEWKDPASQGTLS